MNDQKNRKSTQLEVLVSRIIADADTNKDHEFYSVSGGYDYNITREGEDDSWYIQVNPSEHGFIYDGWWRDSEDESIENAIKEAIKWAMILIDFKG